ncbi:MAG: peptidylprolyl isomerase [Thermoanaerobaculia bacterium]
MFRTMLLITLAAVTATPSTAATKEATGASPIVLALVNGEEITDADLKEGFVGKHGGHTTFLGGETEARRFLDIVINERLLVQEAYSLGLDQDPVVKPLVDAFRDQNAVNYLLKSEIDDKAAPTKDEIREAWETAADLFVAREIVVETRAEAESIRTSLIHGADFETLARMCSTSPTRTRGGSLSPFTWGSLSSEVEVAVFPMEPGEISPVFRTKTGWSVLRLGDRMPANRPALDERVSVRIAAKLTERKKETLTVALSETLWKKYDAHIVLEQLTPRELSRLQNMTPDAVVAEWKGGRLTAAEAFAADELKMYSAFPAGRAAEQIESTLHAAVNTALVREEARARKIAEEVPTVAETVARREAKLMEGVLYAKHVLKNVKVEDADVRNAYEEQKSKLMLPERRRVAHIAVATEEEAKALRERLVAGEPFAELLKKLSLDTESVKNGGDIGWIEKGKVVEMYDPLFELPQGGYSAPIQSANAWHIVTVTEIAPEHPLSFEEAKEKLRTNLLEKKKHDAREIWIGKLREAADIEISEKGIKAYVKANPYEDPNS